MSWEGLHFENYKQVLHHFDPAVALVLALTPLQAVYAAGSIEVNSDADTVADDGLCTLREAITNANADSQLYATAGECAAGNGTDTITFAADYTITLVGSQLPPVTSAIIINGDSPAETIIQANALPNTATYRVFQVDAPGDLTLNGLTVRNGIDNGAGGGGIYNAGALTVSNATISANSANNGDGMYNYFSNATLTNVTFSGNSATVSGGGMYNDSSSATLTNVTFSGNSASNGGGMFNFSSSPTLTNVTFSGNSASVGGGMYNDSSSPTLKNTIIANSSGGDCVNNGSTLNASSSNNLIEGTGADACGLTDGGNGNIIGVDPNLDATLADNGGSTQTHALLNGSPAINAGDNATCATTDQRDITRAGKGPNCDIGAYEYLDSVAPTVLSIVRADPNPTSAATVHFIVTFSEPVTGVDAADFKLANTVQTGASIAGVTPVSASVYTIAVNTDQNGTIRLDIPATATIMDLWPNALVVPYTGGQTYTVSKGNAPTVPVLNTPLNNALVTSTPTLDWNDSSQVMALTVNPWSYEVNITATGGYNETFNTAGNADPLLGLGDSSLTIQPIDALPANTIFYWKVRSYNDQGQYSAWSLTRTFRTSLATPVLNVPANGSTLNNKRPDFEWDSVDGATSYTIQILRTGAAPITATIMAPRFTYTPAADLLQGTTYTWKVKANGANAGLYSALSTFTTSVNPPTTPVLASPANGALVLSTAPQTLVWKASSNTPLSYEVEYANNSTFTGATFVSTTVAAPTVQLLIGALSPGRTYYWHVRSWSGAGATGLHSVWSTVWTIKVKFVAPMLTSPVSGATGVGIRPTFTWSSAGNGLWTSYTLQVANNSAFTLGLRSFTINAPTTTYTIPNSLPALTPGSSIGA